MRLNQLKLFLTVCDCGSLTAASEILHISQPSISVAIRQLEEEFGLNLFYRSKKRLILTDEGKEFQIKASEIINKVKLTEDYMKNLGKKVSRIRLGVSAMASVFLYPKLITAFCRQYPSIHIETHELSSTDSAQQVREGKLDLAIVNNDAVLSDLFEFTPIIETNILGCVSSDHPLARKTGVTPLMLKDEKLVLGGVKGKTINLILQRFKEMEMEPNVFMYSRQVLLIMQVVLQYGAVAFLMEDLLKLNDKLAPFSIHPPIRVALGIIRRKDILLSSDALKFLYFCKDYKYS
ncbi:MAG: LysR family transcriptional regulator [Peptococcaceae bacterium]|jgi:DNA-binding transcriptional LysR family regulator|nr:LysR family transcriptional regulator [Peptococcaceae bacterium]MDH7524453.1 LysR family transcriptional regulator [Peptococcaceae bacterium]